ncbi:N-acetylglucosamine-6-phosphate deacetylase [Aliiglaciecola sp. M165]|uniref:N-acetylglucosamine-6-phosphate deacetylase n=1 Tax=Aliiglaciecola sp. M165 TaxID=2593649 RepID=UPI001180FA35|nr:N-acetylglucosamine-6-phosphate deacetylase [Aliiglaciecola sp. M165]TRY29833.1 N-acetylglucosamine-6-phosphate deacetylase [Aliiglaciecola sp. M165]
MQTTLLASRCFDGFAFHNNALITIESNKIRSIVPDYQGPSDIQVTGLLCSGFIDLQVNGGGGVLFNNAPNVATLSKLINAHARFGTTAMLPTLITDEFKVMQQAAGAVSDAMAQGLPGILGIHFEGPHLSIAKKGIHPPSSIRPLMDQELHLLMRKDLGIVKVTVAPEQVSPDIIAELVTAGVIVSLGHSNANSEQVIAALAAGASGFTHLFNAMSPMTGRAPGMTGTALQQSQAYCGLIVDFHHVHQQNCKLAVQCKGVDKLALVTDAMHHVGSNEKRLPYMNTHILRQGDKLTLQDGTLAGSALNMATAVRNCHEGLSLPLADALRMATSTPAAWLGLQNKRGAIRAEFQADFVVLDSNFAVSQTWIGGEQVFSQTTTINEQE